MKLINSAYSHIVLAALAVVITACSHRDEPAPAPYPQPGGSPYILFGSKVQGLEWESDVHSRDAGAPPMTEMPEVIGVWGYNDAVGMSYSGAGELFRNTPLYNMTTAADQAVADNVSATWLSDYDNNWGYYNAPIASQLPLPWMTSTAETPVNYKFYGYSPYMPSAKADAESFVGLKEIHFTGLDRVSPVDYMVSDKIIQYTASTNPTQNPVQVLKMTHLYSRVQLRFKLGAKYDSLRTVTVKRVELVNLAGYSVDLNIQYNRDASGEYVPTNIWNVVGSGVYDSRELVVKEPVTLDRYNFQTVASAYIYPQHSYPEFDVRVTYDVRDKYGQLLRENDTATSEVHVNLDAYIPGATPGARTLRPGYYYNINILVVPTFLYVLSDNDMGHDGQIEIK